MPATPRTCSWCGQKDVIEACPVCTERWENRQDASEMTAEERAAEFDSLGPILEIDFDKLHQRIQELVGRPVWTHEMGTKGCKYLRHEILSGNQVTLEGVLAKLPPDKPMMVVEVQS